MIWPSIPASSGVPEPADAVPDVVVLAEEEALDAVLVVAAPAVVAVAALPDSSDWRLVSSEWTPDTRAEAALPSGVPLTEAALAELPPELLELPFEGQPVDGGGGAVACEGSAPASMSVRSEDGALDPAEAVFVCVAASACICCQRA